MPRSFDGSLSSVVRISIGYSSSRSTCSYTGSIATRPCASSSPLLPSRLASKPSQSWRHCRLSKCGGTAHSPSARTSPQPPSSPRTGARSKGVKSSASSNRGEIVHWPCRSMYPMRSPTRARTRPSTKLQTSSTEGASSQLPSVRSRPTWSPTRAVATSPSKAQTSSSCGSSSTRGASASASSRPERSPCEIQSRRGSSAPA
ncbi:hypothetical protein D3C72_1485240 [compost metagenome]